MKNNEELDRITQKIYWHHEHGEISKAIDRCKEIQLDAWKQGMTDASELFEKVGFDAELITYIKNRIRTTRDTRFKI